METKKISPRQHEITASFFREMDTHLKDIAEGRVEKMFEVQEFADILHIHPIHLSNTVKLVTGKCPCHFFENKIIDIAKNMLEQNICSIADIARQLTYDPSNFTKFFKKYTHQTPTQYRAFLKLGLHKN